MARRVLYRTGAALVLALGFVSPWGAAHPAVVVLLHVVWAAFLATLGELVGRGHVGLRAGGIVSSIGGLLLLPAIVLATGRVGTTGLFTLVLFMPLVIAALSPDDRGSVVVFAVGGLGWIVADGVGRQLPGEAFAETLVIYVIGSVIAVVATERHARAQADLSRAVHDSLAAMERLAASDRLAVMGQLVAGVAHELRNPLTFISGNLESLREGQGEPAGREAILGDIDAGVKRIHQIARDLTGLSRQGADERGPCDPGAAAAEAVRLASLGTRKREGLELQLPPTLPPVQISHQRLVQVLVNLLINAIQAVEDQADPARRHIRVLALPAAPGRLALAVEDTGPGIPAEALARVFEPFFTTKPPGQGTGLGLALCRQYVERVGGTIGAETRPEGGARFTLELPT